MAYCAKAMIWPLKPVTVSFTIWPNLRSTVSSNVFVFGFSQVSGEVMEGSISFSIMEFNKIAPIIPAIFSTGLFSVFLLLFLSLFIIFLPLVGGWVCFRDGLGLLAIQINRLLW